MIGAHTPKITRNRRRHPGLYESAVMFNKAARSWITNRTISPVAK